MPTTYTNGLKLPDLGSIDWFNAYKNNIDILDPIVGTVNGVATTYAPISHNHDASEITSGTIDIARLPPAALERLTTVADQTARYALTTSTVQLGDTVKQLDTGIMYLVVDTTKLNSADGYVEYSAGTASKAIADEDGTSIKTGYVNVAGNQTVSGQKTFSANIHFTSGLYQRNTTYEIGTTPASNINITQFLADKDSKYTGCLRNAISTTGLTSVELEARNKVGSGALSPTGNATSSTFKVEVQPDGSKTLYFDGSIRNNVLPYTTNTYSLGSPSYQWSSVYAQTYYYKGTQWGLDKANEWTNTNTFSADSYGELIRLKNTGLDLSNGNPALSSAYNHLIWWDDKNNAHYAKLQAWTNDNTSAIVLTSYYRVDANTVRTSSLKNYCNASSKMFFPESNADTELGTSINQWKSVYSQTYFYNGTAWGLDQANVWSQNQSVTNAVTPKFILQDTRNDRTYSASATLSGGVMRWECDDKDGAPLSRISTTLRSDKVVQLQLAIFNEDSTGTEFDRTIRFAVGNTGSAVYYPEQTGNVDLGDSSHKWKTINGINPGALSLPDLSKQVTLDVIPPTGESSVNWSGGANTFTPPANGWISIRHDNCKFIQVYQNTNNRLGVTSERSSYGKIVVSLPVLGGSLYSLFMDAQSGTVHYLFYPCLGNV